MTSPTVSRHPTNRIDLNGSCVCSHPIKGIDLSVPSQKALLPYQDIIRDQVVSPDSGGVLTGKHSHTVLVYDLQEARILTNIGSALLGSCYWSSPLDFQREIEVHRAVLKSSLPNYIGRRIPVFSSLNILWWHIRLNNFSDKQPVDFLEFGWLISYNSQCWPLTTFKNHKNH